MLDALDMAILAALETDGRLSYAALADIVGLSKTPCWSRVQELEKKGILRGYTADIDPRALGLGVVAFIEVMIDFTQRESLRTGRVGQCRNPRMLHDRRRGGLYVENRL